MNPDSDQPRSTPVHSELLPSSRPAFNAGAFFAHKDRLARLCSAVALAALIVAGLALALAWANSRQKVFFVVFDPAGNGHLGQGLEFHEAKDVQLQQAMLAKRQADQEAALAKARGEFLARDKARQAEAKATQARGTQNSHRP